MSYQERIYGQCGLCPERNQTTRSVNTSSDIYVFNRPGYDVSGATKIDCTTPPNSGLTSGDTAVYILSGQTGVTFDFIFTANTQSFTDLNQSKFKFDIYKYDSTITGFSSTSLYTSPIIEWSTFSATSTTTQTIPISSINIDGDYIIKGNFINKVSTEFAYLLGDTYDTTNISIIDEYNIYQPDRDFYFVCISEASTPQFNQASEEILPIGNFVVESFELVQNQTDVKISESSQSYIVALNGIVLSENYDYIITGITNGLVSTNLVILSSPAVNGDIMTVTYISAGFTNQIIDKIIDINSPIVSGTTNGQGSNDIYFNTTTNKYEIYLDTTPISNNDILVTLNGAILANDIDYYQSTSNPKRIILNGNIIINDIIIVYYNTITNLVNTITNPNPGVSWFIDTPPQTTDGLFTVEVSTASTFNIITSANTVGYVVDETSYYSFLPISGSYGDVYYYRVKNEKKYKTLCNSEIVSIKYSEVIPITIGINSINSY